MLGPRLLHLTKALKKGYDTYHPTIWLLTAGRLFNSIIQYMAMPFLTMYLASKGIDTAIIGLVLATNPLGSVLGNLVGGQLSDRLGRKPMMFLGLFLGGVATLGFAVAQSTWQFAALMVFQGFVGALYWPAGSAAMADLTTPENRAGAFALGRTTGNIGAALGPLLGGSLGLAHQGALFLLSGGADMVYALVILLLAVESLPAAARAVRRAEGGEQQQHQSLRDWLTLLRDRSLLWYSVAGLVTATAYSQMYSTYSLYVKSFAAHPEIAYASALSISGVIVVVCQMPVTHLIRRWSAIRALVVGTVLYGVSYAVMALPTAAVILPGAALWTLGEMIAMPSSMTFIADLAPEALRGRYMGASGVAWTAGMMLANPFGMGLLKLIGGPKMMLAVALVALLGASIYPLAARKRQNAAVTGD